MKLHLLQLSLEWLSPLSSPSYFESHAIVFYHLLFLLVSVPSISLWNILMINLLKSFCVSFIIFLLMMGNNFLFLYSVQSNLSIALKRHKIFMMVHVHNGILLSYSKNAFESVLMRWMKLEPIIESEESQKEKHQYSIQGSRPFPWKRNAKKQNGCLGRPYK